jgi:Leucine Rich Repeat (LRR) protein
MTEDALLQLIERAAKEHLQSLELRSNQLNSLPPEIGKLTSLQSLDLRNNWLSSLPPEIGKLTSLQSLDLRNNWLSSLPPEIGKLTSLQSLNLNSNQLSSLPSEIGKLTSLQRLELSSNRLSSLPSEIGELTSLQRLELSSNRLSSLPPEIGKLTSLQSLELSGNWLRSLPPEIGKLTSLQSLDLSGNWLRSLPLEIGKLTNLQSLDLSNNWLRSLPPEIGALTSLRSLNLSSNQLSNLPPEIGALTSLRSLDLSSNQLSSQPPEIGKLTGRQLHEPREEVRCLHESFHVSHDRNGRVTFSVFGPQVIAPGQNFVLDLWAHLPIQAEMVLSWATKMGRDKMSGVKTGVAVASGAILSVLVEIPSLRVADPIDTMTWEGEPVNSSFIVETPSDAALGEHSGRAIISAYGLPLAKVSFSLTVQASAIGPDEIRKSLKALERKHRSAFASYSSLDRDEVFGRIQGMKKVLPELDIFLDVLSLRSGQDWDQQLRLRIPEKDVFFLFWSLNASKSKEVDKEWRLALETRGLNYIDPSAR